MTQQIWMQGDTGHEIHIFFFSLFINLIGYILMLREKSSKYLLKTICEWSHKTILLSTFSSLAL